MKKIPLLLIVLFCNCSLLFAQNFVSVKKPGRLSKEMSKADISSGVTKLQIEGVLNSEDLSYLSSLSSLETLDLTKVYFTQENSRHPFAQTKIYLSGFPSLLNLLLPEYQNDFCIEITIFFYFCYSFNRRICITDNISLVHQSFKRNISSVICIIKRILFLFFWISFIIHFL